MHGRVEVFHRPNVRLFFYDGGLYRYVPDSNDNTGLFDQAEGLAKRGVGLAVCSDGSRGRAEHSVRNGPRKRFLSLVASRECALHTGNFKAVTMRIPLESRHRAVADSFSNCEESNPESIHGREKPDGEGNCAAPRGHGGPGRLQSVRQTA